MPLIFLVLTWLLSGIIIGALALAAHFKPIAWNRYGWLWFLLMTGGTALLGGLLGFWIFGRPFATPTAIWFAILTTFVPWLISETRKRLRKAPPENLTETEKGAA